MSHGLDQRGAATASFPRSPGSDPSADGAGEGHGATTRAAWAAQGSAGSALGPALSLLPGSDRTDQGPSPPAPTAPASRPFSTCRATCETGHTRASCLLAYCATTTSSHVVQSPRRPGSTGPPTPTSLRAAIAPQDRALQGGAASSAGRRRRRSWKVLVPRRPSGQ